MSSNYQMRHANRERHELPFDWPKEPFHIVLVEPMIPPNTGNIARLCAATGTILHLVGPLGFDISDKQLRRAGLDYWENVNIKNHTNFEEYISKFPTAEKYFFTTSAKKDHANISYQPGSHLIFGNEAKGLSDELIDRYSTKCYNIPIKLNAVRSLNLSNAASIALYTALRRV